MLRNNIVFKGVVDSLDDTVSLFYSGMSLSEAELVLLESTSGRMRFKGNPSRTLEKMGRMFIGR
jgi:hypothetical protein